MNVQELRYVVAVAQAGSINKAALNLYVSQSTLSRAVQEVEARIGISLFQRTNKGAIPTHDGLKLIERARRLLLEFDQLEGQYYNHEKVEQETLLVATQRCTPVILAFIEYYQKRCEGKRLLNLALKEDTTDNIIRLVSSRIYGIGILHYTSDQETAFLHKCRSVDLETHLLEVSPVVAQVRYGHPLSNRNSILVRELRPYPHVTFADEDITNINYCSDVSQYNPSILEKRIVIQDRGTLRQIVDCTDCYYVGCDFSRFSTPACSPVYIPLEDVPFTLNTLWVKSRGRKLSQAEQAFIAELENTYEKQ